MESGSKGSLSLFFLNRNRAFFSLCCSSLGSDETVTVAARKKVPIHQSTDEGVGAAFCSSYCALSPCLWSLWAWASETHIQFSFHFDSLIEQP